MQVQPQPETLWVVTVNSSENKVELITNLKKQRTDGTTSAWTGVKTDTPSTVTARWFQNVPKMFQTFRSLSFLPQKLKAIAH